LRGRRCKKVPCRQYKAWVEVRRRSAIVPTAEEHRQGIKRDLSVTQAV
jgi:hypothetical protein